jgi:hypothetical protein
MGLWIRRKKIRNKRRSKKNKNLCYFKYPTKCYTFIYNNIFDKNKDINCKIKNKNSKINLLEYKGENFNNTTTFVYPITKNYLFSDIIYDNHKFPNKIIKDIYDIKNPPLNSPKPEVTVTFDDEGNGKVNIEITKDENLIKNKSELFNKINPKYKNVYFIFIDSLSREHFYKKLPKTKELLEKYYWDNKNKEKTHSSYQFFKYQNFAGWTDINVTPMLFGKKQMTRGSHIVKHFNDNGYITANSGNFCTKLIFPIYRWNNGKYNDFYFDYELISLFCDPNVNNPNDCFSNKNPDFGYYSNYRNCLYGKDSFEYVFEYSLKFLEIYKNENKFLHIFFNDAHESSGEVIKYMDNSLKNFIEELINNYTNEKSMILLVSDHGRGIKYPIKIDNFEDNNIERTLGMLFIIMSNNNDNYYNKTAMSINEQKFITPYDIYMTMLKGLKNVENYKSNKGKSLDEEIDGMERNCDKYNDFNLKSNPCRCINFK